jgi:hypothetical protein
MTDDLLQDGDSNAPAKKPRATRVAPLGTHVQMKRDTEVYSAPHTAEVHRDEIDNWAKHGWEQVD